MNNSYDLVILNGTCAKHDGITKIDIGIKNGVIVALENLKKVNSKKVLNIAGLHVLPGVIDTQVHFREPGSILSEDLKSGSMAAILGGVTSVFEMPNTSPPTTNEEALNQKLKLARKRMYCDYAFYIGATPENINFLPNLQNLPGCCGIKIFAGSSTGTLLVANYEQIEEIIKNSRGVVAVHSEDEFMLRARKKYIQNGDVKSHIQWRNVDSSFFCTKQIIQIAQKLNKKVHILHVSTKEEMDLLSQNKNFATVEATPQHLTFYYPECYEKLGTFSQMNPPIREKIHHDAIWSAVENGTVDLIGSDHAPHLKKDKMKKYPNSPSGMPGVQTLVPLLLDHYNNGRISLEKIVNLTSYNAHKIFGIRNKGILKEGFDADFTIVDINSERIIDNRWIASKCGWSPFHGKKIKGWPVGTIVRGNIVAWKDKIQGSPVGKELNFKK